MGYLKFKGSQLFDGYRITDTEQVLILTEDGVVENILPLRDAGDEVQVGEGILAPGFINCHCHLELSHMKGKIEEQTGLPDFVYRVVTERHSPEETILAAIEAAEFAAAWAWQHPPPQRRARSGQSARGLWQMRVEIKRQRHNDRSLGDGRHHSRAGVSHLSERLSQTCDRRVRQQSGGAGSARKFSGQRDRNH